MLERMCAKMKSWFKLFRVPTSSHVGSKLTSKHGGKASISHFKKLNYCLTNEKVKAKPNFPHGAILPN